MESSSVIVQTGKSFIGDTRFMLRDEDELNLDGQLWIRSGYLRRVPVDETPLTKTTFDVKNASSFLLQDLETPDLIVPGASSYCQLIPFHGLLLFVDYQCNIYVHAGTGEHLRTIGFYTLGMPDSSRPIGAFVWKGKLYVGSQQQLVEVNVDGLLQNGEPMGDDFNRCFVRAARIPFYGRVNIKAILDEYGHIIFAGVGAQSSNAYGYFTRTTVPVDEWIRRVNGINAANWTSAEEYNLSIAQWRDHDDYDQYLRQNLLELVGSNFNHPAFPFTYNSTYSYIRNIPSQLQVRNGVVVGAHVYGSTSNVFVQTNNTTNKMVRTLGNLAVKSGEALSRTSSPVSLTQEGWLVIFYNSRQISIHKKAFAQYEGVRQAVTHGELNQYIRIR